MRTPSLASAHFYALIFAFFSSAHACEKPVLTKNVSLGEFSQSNFKMDWTHDAKAKFYELKYVVRIPEGRTLAQSEVIATKPFHIFLADELPKAETIQLIVEVAAQCDTAKSPPAFVQIALKNPSFSCRFDGQTPALKNDALSWPAVPGAQGYLICLHMAESRPTCHETSNTTSMIVPQSASLVGIAPICNNVTGTPVYVSTKTASVSSR